MSQNGFKLPKSLNDSLQENLAEIGRQAESEDRRDGMEDRPFGFTFSLP